MNFLTKSSGVLWGVLVTFIMASGAHAQHLTKIEVRQEDGERSLEMLRSADGDSITVTITQVKYAHPVVSKTVRFIDFKTRAAQLTRKYEDEKLDFMICSVFSPFQLVASWFIDGILPPYHVWEQMRRNAHKRDGVCQSDYDQLTSVSVGLNYSVSYRVQDLKPLIAHVSYILRPLGIVHRETTAFR